MDEPDDIEPCYRHWPSAADRLERVRRLMEARAFEPLSLDQLAAEAGLSPFHFARQFQARFGMSPMWYVRACRMRAAVRALRDEDGPALVELAFDLGFETQEGFTRAFKRAYGVTPGRYRRAVANKEDIAMTDVAMPAHLVEDPEPRRTPALRIAGLRGVITETDKSAIPGLWDGLVRRLPLPGQSDGRTFGVIWMGEAGVNYLAGAPIAAGAAVPDGLEVKDVPASTYLVFRQTLTGPDIGAQMQAAAREIWGERLPKSGRRLGVSPDLEVYPAYFDPNRPGAVVEWWISIEG